MAESSNRALKKLEDQQTCPLCLQTYSFKDLKLLQCCFRVYSKDCIQQLLVTDRQGQLSLCCPTCRQTTLLPPATGVSGLQPAFRIHNTEKICENHETIEGILCGKLANVRVEVTSSTCQQFDEVYVPQVSPEKCYITGKGLEVAKVGERTTAVLHVVDNMGAAYTKPVETLTCELVSEITGEKTDCSMKKIEKRGQYEISYQGTSQGRHQLHVKMEGEDIMGSPFFVLYKQPLNKLGTAIKIITGAEAISPIWPSTNCLKWPWGVAVTSITDDIIVTEHNGNLVSIFNSSDIKINTLGTKGSALEFNGPAGVVVDGEGYILVADRGNKSIKRFKSDIQSKGQSSEWSPSSGFDPTGLVVYNKRLYVADCNNFCIKILPSDLKFPASPWPKSFGSRGSGDGQFEGPIDVACDKTGNVYVADSSNHRIQVFTAEGQFLWKFGRLGCGNGELNAPTGICIGCDNVAYVSEYGNNRVSLFKCNLDKKNASFVKTIGTEVQQFNRPYGIALDKHENIYVADFYNNRLIKL